MLMFPPVTSMRVMNICIPDVMSMTRVNSLTRGNARTPRTLSRDVSIKSRSHTRHIATSVVARLVSSCAMWNRLHSVVAAFKDSWCVQWYDVRWTNVISPMQRNDTSPLIAIYKFCNQAISPLTSCSRLVVTMALSRLVFHILTT